MWALPKVQGFERPVTTSIPVCTTLRRLHQVKSSIRAAWRQKWHLVSWNPAVPHAAISLLCSEAELHTLHLGGSRN